MLRLRCHMRQVGCSHRIRLERRVDRGIHRSRSSEFCSRAHDGAGSTFKFEAPAVARSGAVAARSDSPHQQSEVVVEPPRKPLDGYYPQSGGGELECERDAVQLAAHVRHVRRVFIGQLEARHHQSRPFDEELDRVGVRHLRGRRSFGPTGYRQGLDPPRSLAFHAERFSAGRQHHQPRACAQQHVDQLSAAAGEMLASPLGRCG